MDPQKKIRFSYLLCTTFLYTSAINLKTSCNIVDNCSWKDNDKKNLPLRLLVI